MKKLFDYVAFRVFEFFNRKAGDLSIARTISFLSILELSLTVPIFLIIKLFIKNDKYKILNEDFKMRYSIAIPIAILLIFFTNLIYRRKLQGKNLERLFEKYHSENYKLSIWVIFFAPLFFLIICPMIYGALNGTLSFPIFSK